jgi:phosphatidylglycerophosphatase A
VESTWKKWVITGGGLGLLKPAPGSWGTLGPAVIFWMLLWADVADPWRSAVCLAGAVIAGVLTVQLSPWAIAWFGREDPGSVVLDEYCGYWVACLFLPLPATSGGSLWHAWLAAAGVYILFRLTDTLKLPPCRQLEHLPAGWGILFDDIAAGIQVNIILQILLRVVHI